MSALRPLIHMLRDAAEMVKDEVSIAALSHGEDDPVARILAHHAIILDRTADTLEAQERRSLGIGEG